MAKQPPKSNEDITNATMQDIKVNATGSSDQFPAYDERYVLQRILRAIREARGAVVLALCILLPFAAHAGTVTCAAKSYKDITYAALSTAAGASIVTLWQGAVREESAYKHITPKNTIILNSEMTYEFEDLQLHIAGE